MPDHHVAAPVGKRLLTPGVWVLLGLIAVGLSAALYRFVFGLGAATNLDNQYPWGLWIAIDVASGVALAAGGFTTAALAHIFHRHRYEVLVRPALLTAMLGYTFVALGLLVDLGRYYNIWHPMLPSMWQGNSVLFEVAMCVMCYLTVLYIEFLPIVCERFVGRVALPGPLATWNRLVDRTLQILDRTLGKTITVFIVLGIVLSFMHQSSLGSLMLIAPTKMHPLWYTPILPLLFLMSAIMVGYPMVVFESILASRTFKRRPEMDVLTPLSRVISLFVGTYLVVKLGDMFLRDTYVYLFDGSVAANAFLLELGLGLVLPLALLVSHRVRRSPWGLFTAAALIVGGVALNRVNVFLVAYQPPFAEARYVPSLLEILTTIGLIAALVFVYRVLVTVFPVLPAEHDAGDLRSNAV